MKSLLSIIILIFSYNLFSQNDSELFNKMVTNDSSSATILFSYPENIRNSIYITSTYPQGFIRINEIQKKSSASLKDAIAIYSRNKQKEIWDITRYPELTSLLIENKDKSKNDLEILLERYPEKIKRSAIYFAKNNYSMLVDIETIYINFKQSYNEILKDFPDSVKTSFNTLIKNPELITVLSEDMNTTVTLGDIYKRNPKLIKRKGDSLNYIIVTENGIEYEAWKNGIAKDSAVQKELKQVSKEYAKDMQEDDVYGGTYNTSNPKVVINVDPYPYWAGYPYWYGRNYWYPNPWWLNLGFYYPIDGSMFFLGLPTYNFGWWYYNHPNYYNHYPKTSHYFYNHYNGHRNSNSQFNRSVHESQQPGRRR